MDRDTLLKMISEMEDGSLSVTVGGNLRDSEGDDYTVSDAKEAIDDLNEIIDRFCKVLAWAKLAPEIKL